MAITVCTLFGLLAAFWMLNSKYGLDALRTKNKPNFYIAYGFVDWINEYFCDLKVISEADSKLNGFIYCFYGGLMNNSKSVKMFNFSKLFTVENNNFS